MTVAASVQHFVLQCTDAVHQLLSWTSGPAAFRGNAGTWASAGAAAGYPVSHVPAAGDVAVWNANQFVPGLGQASSVGHVAAVAGVDPGTGNVTIEQANWPEGSAIHPTVLTRAEASQLQYVGPKGSTPGLSNGGPLGAGGNFTGSSVQTATAGFDWNPIDWPGKVLGWVGNTAGSLLGGAAGSAAGEIAGGVLSGVVAFGGSFGEATLFPWFKRNSVPLIAGVIIWAILTHKTDAAPNFNFDVPIYGGGSERGSAPPKNKGAEEGGADEIAEAPEALLAA